MSKITRRCAVCVIARSTHLAFTRPNPSTLPSWVSKYALAESPPTKLLSAKERARAEAMAASLIAAV